jgi:hypothetical protein
VSYATDTLSRRIAQTLANHSVVFAPTNMDERAFVKRRIEQETLKPEILVIGSSRIMQVGKHTLRDRPVLNLAVSGASIEDHIAILGMATQAFQPDTILIGLDPWLFNKNSEQDRWMSVSDDYLRARQHLGLPSTRETSTNGDSDDAIWGHISSLVGAAYFATNQVEYATDDDARSVFRHKIRRDGSRIYDKKYATKGRLEIMREFDGILAYAMSGYTVRPGVVGELEHLVKWCNSHHNVVLILSPYHPALYDRMRSEHPIFLEVEEKFRRLAQRTNVKLLGSYDARKVGCFASEFYDGMHPKGSCMARVLGEFRN